MKPLTLKAFSNLTSVVCFVCAVAFAAASLGLYTLVGQLDRQIDMVERQSDPNVIAMNEIVGNLGFGGMIHAFKNHLLRGGEEIRVFDQSTGATLSNLDKLERQLGAAHEADIEAVRAMVEDYAAQIEVVRRIRAMDDQVEAIDRVVRVDDSHAAAALDNLRKAVIEDGESTKWKVLFELRRALGYDGMIHHFKNYVLRKSPDYETQARAAIDRALIALEAYRSFGVNETEAAALDDLAGVIVDFRVNLDIAAEMIAAGATAAELDAAVGVTKDAAYAAFITLGKQIQLEYRACLADLHAQMALLKQGAVAMALIVCLGVIGFSLGLHYVIERIVVRPAAAIAQGLGALAAGETHVDLSAYASDTEIGRIARASRRFREALVDNIRKSEDLRGLSLERDDMLREHARMVAERAEYTTKRAALERLRADEQEDLQNLRDAIGTVIENLENGIFNYRIDEVYEATHLGGLARDINRMLSRMDEAFRALAKAVVAGDQALPGGPDPEDVRAATLMRESMTHALQTLNDAIEEVQRGAEMLRYANP